MEKLLHLTLVFLSASCAAQNVTLLAATEGDTISVNCSYEPRRWWRGKSWWRQRERGRWQRVASAPPAWLPLPGDTGATGATAATATLRDNARAGLLSLTLRQLRREDAGLYQCRTEFLGDTRSLSMVRLEVLAAQPHGQRVPDTSPCAAPASPGSPARGHPPGTSAASPVVFPAAADLVSPGPEEPRAVQSIPRSHPNVDFTVFYILAGFLVAKFLVAVLVCGVAHSRKSRARGQKPGLAEQQALPFPAGLGHDGIGLSWESSA